MITAWELTKSRPRSISGVELDGEKLVRLIYLDETGISVKERITVVAGVIIDADRQWKVVEQYISALINVYVPEEHRDGFVFHAKDLYHGAGPIFDRRKYPLEQSREALKKLIELPSQTLLPVVWGYVIKDGLGGVRIPRNPRNEAAINQAMAFSFCAIAAEKYMRDKADPHEIAALFAENNNDTRKAVKQMHTILRGKNLRDAANADFYSTIEKLNPNILPVRRIVDTVYFADKDDAVLLQIADACALIIRYCLEGKPNCQEFFDALSRNNSQGLLNENKDDELGGYRAMDFGPVLNFSPLLETPPFAQKPT